MHDDLVRRLSNLRELHELGVIDAGAYELGLERLRERFGPDAVDALLERDRPRPPTGNSQTFVGSQIGAAVAGSVYGPLFIGGQRGRSEAELLAGYLRRMAKQCDALPLQGVRQQRSASDTLTMSLERVYTQLAVIEVVAREYLSHAALRVLDAEHYWKAHVGEHLLPSEQRTSLLVPSQLGTSSFDLGHGTSGDFAAWCAQVREIPQGRSDLLSYFTGPQLVTEAIAAHQRLVLLGEPGSGKSTALRYLALTLAEAGLNEQVDLAVRLAGWGEPGRLLPVLLPLLPLARRLAKTPERAGDVDDLWDELVAHLEPRGANTGLAAVVWSELEAGRVLLLLDGLDEVAGDESRRKVIRAVVRFAERYPGCRMVVACRVRAYAGGQNRDWQLPGWPTATLADWTPGQMDAFVGAWYASVAQAGALSEAKRDERTAALRQALQRRADLRRLGVRPLLLTMMALVHLNDGRLPEDRVSLYRRCLELLLGQWELAGKDASDYGTLMQYIGLPDSDAQALLPLLRQVAAAAQEAATAGDLGRVGRATMRELVSDFLEKHLKHPDPHRGAKRFLEYTDLRAGLLQASDAGDAYAFPHQTFQEYLAGLELISGPDFVNRIMARRGDDRWRVSIFLGLGHAVSEGLLAIPFQLLSRLLAGEPGDPARRQRDLVLAAELAEDVGWERLEDGGAEFKRLRADLARALAPVVEGTVLPAAERVRAGALLGALGDPRPGVCTLPPAMVELPGGSFVIGSSLEEIGWVGQAYEQYYLARGEVEAAKQARTWPENEINDQPVHVRAFAIGRYPVTNAQYALFIADRGYDPDQSWWDEAGRDWLARNRRNQPYFWDDEQVGQGYPNHPVIGVTWYEAIAFCGWLCQQQVYNPHGWAYRLPSEAEWEYSARGSGRRTYPWGETIPDDERASREKRYEGTTPVGSFASGSTPEGVFDLVGNVGEWTCSVFALYPYHAHDGRELVDNPAKKRFIARGSTRSTARLSLRAAYRNHFSPNYHYTPVGFRLARSLPEAPHPPSPSPTAGEKGE